MIILTIRTDKPNSELGLYRDESRIAYIIWESHRRLAETIHLKINKLMRHQNMKLKDIQAIIVFKGPGSFTGLRIGLSVANALASGLQIAIVGSQDKDWVKQGVLKLQKAKNDVIVMPEYGALPNVSQPKK